MNSLGVMSVLLYKTSQLFAYSNTSLLSVVDMGPVSS